MKQFIISMAFWTENARGAICAIGLALPLLLVAGCGPATIPTGINDPNEARNRQVHDWNKRFDQALMGQSEPADATLAADEAAVAPAAPVLSDAPAKPPSPLLIALGNFGANLDHPRKILNSLLQVRPGDAAHNTLRLGINTTIGIGGIFDVARAAGLPEIDTDFGETLHVWGVGEGSYVELPVIGPSTQRDAVGKTVDFVINPLWYVFPWPTNLAANGFTWAGEATDRLRYSQSVDSILYDSADSYSQSRLIYLQNRRFELARGDATEDESVDLYEELYGE